VNELPFMAGYLLVASTVLALADGDLASPGGAVGAAGAALVLVGLAIVVRRALLADSALGNAPPHRRPWARIVRAPFAAGRRDVVRLRGLAYGEGSRRLVDVHHRRDRPQGVPVLLHLHGGGFRSGSRGREAKPLMRHLASRRGVVCVSAGYRLQPHVTIDDQVADVRAALAWTRAHAAEFGGDPRVLFVAGSSAGANLAIRAVDAGETGLAGLVCRYGYYGDLTPHGDVPPLLVVHGSHDLLVPAADVRAFAERARAASRRPVRYAELPGAHHDFDLFESIRSAAVCRAVEDFVSRTQRRPAPGGRD
jgi:acetyl esterase/lipase